jgi:hypothetical protein
MEKHQTRLLIAASANIVHIIWCKPNEAVFHEVYKLRLNGGVCVNI